MRKKMANSENEGAGEHEFSLDENLTAFEKKDLIDLIGTLVDNHTGSRLTAMDWILKRSNKKNQIDKEQVSRALDEERMWSYWGGARPIISSFNEYGGGPHDEEDDCYDHLYCLQKLIEKGNISKRVIKDYRRVFQMFSKEHSC